MMTEVLFSPGPGIVTLSPVADRSEQIVPGRQLFLAAYGVRSTPYLYQYRAAAADLVVQHARPWSQHCQNVANDCSALVLALSASELILRFVPISFSRLGLAFSSLPCLVSKLA